MDKIAARPRRASPFHPCRPSAGVALLRPVALALFLCAALLPGPAPAQDGRGLQATLADVILMAETADPTPAIIALEGQIAAEGITTAKAQRRPRAALKLDYTQTQQTIVSQDNETFQKGQSSYPVATVTLTVTQPIYDAARFRELPLARAEEELSAARAEAQLIDLNRQIVASFLQVALAQNRLREARLIAAVRKDFALGMAELVQSGRGSLDRQMQAEGDVFSAESAVAEAEANVADALFELHRFTGIEVAGVRAEGGFAVVDPQSIAQTFTLERLDELNPDVAIALAELSVAERQLAQVRGRFLPSANLKLEGEYTQSQGSLFGGGSTVGSIDAGVEINWSIYEGGVRRSQMRVAQHRIEIAQLRVEQARDRAQGRFVALMESLDQARRMVAAAGREQRSATERVTAAEDSLSAGAGSREAVLEAGLRRDIARLAGSSARMRVALIQAEIYALFGALDTDALSRDFAGG